MADTTFATGVALTTQWLQDVNDTTYKPIKVAIIGDSLTTQNVMLSEAISFQIERVINQMGGKIKILDFGRDGHNFYRANTTTYINGQTSVQATIAAKPNIVLVVLGFNDAITNNDGRTLTQIKNDAAATFAALYTGLPTAKIYYVYETPYDTVNFIPSTLKNKGVIPWSQTLKSSGILSGLYTSEILDDALSPTTKTNYQNWKDLDTYIKTLPNITGNFEFNVWKIARLGGCAEDRLHFNSSGKLVATGYFLEGLRGLTEFASLFSNNYDYWEKPNTLFATILTASGDGYVYTEDGQASALNSQAYGNLHPTTWNLPKHTTCYGSTSVYNDIGSIFSWSILGARANSTVYLSINGGSFFAIDITTSDGHANAATPGSQLSSLLLIDSSNILRYKVDNIVYDPISCYYLSYYKSWNTASYNSGWSTYTPYASPAKYLKDNSGVVYLRGTVTGITSGTTIFTLPVGFRPPYMITFPTTASAAFGFVQIDTSGNVTATGSVAGVALDNIYFSVT